MSNAFDYRDIINLEFENEKSKNAFLDEIVEYILSSKDLTGLYAILGTS